MSHEPLKPGTKLPLIYSYSDCVQGNGFVAKVELRGRALSECDEDHEVWIYAVHPSGWADVGCSIGEAHALFRQSWTAALYDVAGESASFADFRRRVDALNVHAEPLLESWKEAVKSVSEQKGTWSEKLNLRVESAALMPRLTVTEIRAKDASPASNHLDSAMPKVATRNRRRAA